MSQKMTTLIISVPYKGAGNIITQEQVSFDVYREADYYKLVPSLSEEEIRIANLPPELRFSMVEGKAVSHRGNKDGNFHVIQDAVAQLKQHHRME